MTILQHVHEFLTSERRERLKQIKQWRWFARNLRAARKLGGLSLCVERDTFGTIFRISVKSRNAK